MGYKVYKVGNKYRVDVRDCVEHKSNVTGFGGIVN